MSTSSKIYNRWHPIEPTTWPYRCLVKYYDEINRLLMSHLAASKFSYSQLAKNGALWESKLEDFLYAGSKGNNRLTIKDWSKTYNQFSNWCRLNAIMALTSSFETYIESVIWLAIESDPGLLIKAPHSIDGVFQLKYGHRIQRELIEKKVESCTRGDWQSRIKNLEMLLGTVPNYLKDNISDLEKLRQLRNRIGHAFGRDIEKSREYSKASIEPMAFISEKKLRDIQKLIRTSCRQIDDILNNNHIGLFPLLYFYHIHYEELEKHPIDIDRHVHLKSLIGKREAGNKAYSKSICKWVVNYYESL